MTQTKIMQGQNIVITGATSGLGVEIAATLSKAGAKVFLGGRREAEGEKVANEIGAKFCKVDVSKEESNKAFFEAAREHFGDAGVDAVLLNAGVEGAGGNDSSVDVANYELVFGVNVQGIVLGIKYGTPLLNKGGKILCTSSVVSVLSVGAAPLYCASKAAVDSLVRCFAAQYASETDERLASLQINSMNAAAYKTAMADRFMGTDDIEQQNAIAKAFNPCGRIGQPSELASTVLKYLQGELRYKSGDCFAVDADQHFPLAEYHDRVKQTAA